MRLFNFNVVEAPPRARDPRFTSLLEDDFVENFVRLQQSGRPWLVPHPSTVQTARCLTSEIEGSGVPTRHAYYNKYIANSRQLSLQEMFNSLKAKATSLQAQRRPIAFWNRLGKRVCKSGVELPAAAVGSLTQLRRGEKKLGSYLT